MVGPMFGAIGLAKEIKLERLDNPFNASFKWVDGKVVMANWIYIQHRPKRQQNDN